MGPALLGDAFLELVDRILQLFVTAWMGFDHAIRIPRDRCSITTAKHSTDVKRLKELERENATLKRLLADAELEKAALKEVARGNF